MKNIGKQLVYKPAFVFYGLAAVVSVFMAIGFYAMLYHLFVWLWG